MRMRENQERSSGLRSDLIGMLLMPTGLLHGQYYRIGLLTVHVNEGDPDIMVLMASGDRVHKSLYIDIQEGASGVIEIV